MRRSDVLIIAGTDSSGGAGLLRDIAVTRDLGIQARCADKFHSPPNDDRSRPASLPKRRHRPAGCTVGYAETGS